MGRRAGSVHDRLRRPPEGADIGLNEHAAYLTSPVKYRPARGRPSRAAVAHGRLHLRRQLDILDPKIVVLLGQVACRGALNEEVAVRKRHGLIVERAGTTYLIICHPAAAARFPAIRKAVLQDFRTLKRLAQQRLSQARHDPPVVSRGMAGGPSRLGREDGKRHQDGVHGSPAD